MTRHIGSRARSTSLALTLATALLAAGGCQPPLEEAEQFRRGLPRPETVRADVPGRQGQALTVEPRSQALQGLPSELHALTFGVTTTLNGAALFVGVLVKAVLRFPPTSLTTDTAVWGPWSDDLDPVTWKVTITRVGEHRYQYRFEGQPRANPAAPFVVVLAGTHAAALDAAGNPIEGFGDGGFTLDWDARNTLPVVRPREVGKAHYTYSRQPGAVASIDAELQQVRDEKTGNLVDAGYGYTRQPGGGGTMDFIHIAAPQPGMPGGRWAVRSRWSRSGAGRADVQVTVTDLPGPLGGSECWSELFFSTYKKYAWTPLITYGDEATDCVFPTPEWSKL